MPKVPTFMAHAMKGAGRTGAAIAFLAASLARRARVSARAAWIILAFGVVACVVLAISLPKYTAHPLEFKLISTASGALPDPWEHAQDIDPQMPYKVVLELSPEHLHAGEEFFLAVHVFWMPDEGEIAWERFVNSLKLPAFVWERDVHEYREVRGSVHYVRRTHVLQAVGSGIFGSPYKIEFDQFAWRRSSSNTFAVEPQQTYIFLTPRFAEKATPRLAPLAGPIHPFHAWMRNALAGVSVASVLLAVVYGASALWQLRSKHSGSSLDERYALMRTSRSSAREQLFALEELSTAVLLERGENPMEIWQGRLPSWQKSVLERLWPMFAKAYQSTEPTIQDARGAYAFVGALMKARKRERKQ